MNLQWADVQEDSDDDSDNDTTRLNAPEDEESPNDDHDDDYGLSQTASINQLLPNCPPGRTPTRGSNRSGRGRRGGRNSQWYVRQL